MDHGFAATGPHRSPDTIKGAERFSANVPMRQLPEEAQPIIGRATDVGASR